MEEKKELYGLDMDFLEDLGLGDILNDLEEEGEKERRASVSRTRVASRGASRGEASPSKMLAHSESENMTLDELR